MINSRRGRRNHHRSPRKSSHQHHHQFIDQHQYQQQQFIHNAGPFNHGGNSFVPFGDGRMRGGALHQVREHHGHHTIGNARVTKNYNNHHHVGGGGRVGGAVAGGFKGKKGKPINNNNTFPFHQQQRSHPHHHHIPPPPMHHHAYPQNHPPVQNGPPAGGAGQPQQNRKARRRALAAATAAGLPPPAFKVSQLVPVDHVGPNPPPWWDFMVGSCAAFIEQGEENEATTAPINIQVHGQDKKTKHNVCAQSLLHMEILAFEAYTNPTQQEALVRDSVTASYARVMEKRFPGSKVYRFGSSSSNLNLPWADIDLVLMLNDDSDGSVSGLSSSRMIPSPAAKGAKMLKNPVDLARNQNSSKLSKLMKPLQNAGLTSGIQIIRKARVPILKITDRQSGLKLDVACNVESGVRAAQAVRGWLKEVPGLRPLVMLLKQFLLVRGLNDVATGGVGGYGLLLWVMAFLRCREQRGYESWFQSSTSTSSSSTQDQLPRPKDKQTQEEEASKANNNNNSDINLGALFIDFCNTFSAFDYARTGISFHAPTSHQFGKPTHHPCPFDAHAPTQVHLFDVRSVYGPSKQKKDDPDKSKPSSNNTNNTVLPPFCVLDPLDGTRNVMQGSHQIHKVAKALEDAMWRLSSRCRGLGMDLFQRPRVKLPLVLLRSDQHEQRDDTEEQEEEEEEEDNHTQQQQFVKRQRRLQDEESDDDGDGGGGSGRYIYKPRKESKEDDVVEDDEKEDGEVGDTSLSSSPGKRKRTHRARRRRPRQGEGEEAVSRSPLRPLASLRSEPVHVDNDSGDQPQPQQQENLLLLPSLLGAIVNVTRWMQQDRERVVRVASNTPNNMFSWWKEVWDYGTEGSSSQNNNSNSNSNQSNSLNNNITVFAGIMTNDSGGE